MQAGQPSGGQKQVSRQGARSKSAVRGPEASQPSGGQKQVSRQGARSKSAVRGPEAGHPQGVALLYTSAPQRGNRSSRVGPAPEAVTEARASAPQATRKGWPYSRRPLQQQHERFVYSRATPIGVHLSPCERAAGHPQGVALLYAAPQAARTPRI